MAKSKSSKPATTGHTSKGKYVAIPINEQIKKLRKLIPLLAFLTGSGIIAYFSLRSHPESLCMLYLWANNGKMSGRADGNVYMRNGRTRGFRVPSLVRNAYTSLVRSIFTGFSQAFSNLTSDQILSWDNFSYVKSNRFAQFY